MLTGEQIWRRVAEQGWGRVAASIARAHRMQPASMFGRDRHPRTVKARDRFMAIVRDTVGMSFPELGAMVDRDHSSVISAVARHHERLMKEHGAKEGSEAA